MDGIVGAIDGTEKYVIDNCKANLIVETISGESAGGIVGRITSSTCDISNCSNSKNITAQTRYAGGIVGVIINNSNVTIDMVYNNSSIKTLSANCAGGIVGLVTNKSVATIGEAYNTGSLNASTYCTGGIVGCSGDSSITTIESCFNIGKISGYDCYGGILGAIDGGTGIIKYCHNYGTISVSSVDSRGGILGYRNGSYTGTANYWLSTCGAYSGIGYISDNTNATPYTLEQMKTQSNFVGWDFDEIWKMDETKGYPVLRNLPDIPDIIE